MKRNLLCLLIAVCLLVPAGTFAQGNHYSPVRPQMLVSTDWLAAKMHRGNDLVVVHVGSTRATYDTGHIPGAVFLSLSQIAFTQNGVLNEIAPVAQLKAAFEALGISDHSTVVLYSDSQGELAARTWYTLNYVGHGGSAALLDGGLEKWRAEGRDITTAIPIAQPGTFTPHVNPSVIAHVPQVLDASWQVVNVPDSGLVLLDTRTPGEYTGETASAGVPRAGHIPGAFNLYWPNLIVSATDPTFLDSHQLRKIFESYGITPDKRVIVYCRTGMKASPVYFVLSYLGYDVVMFDGSFSQWSSTPYTPIVAGPNAF